MARRALLTLLLYFTIAHAQILTPPYFNLAQGKRITATATCGDEGQELYCKLGGANTGEDEHVIQGQICDICDSTSDTKKHPPEYAVDGMETWWQSPPLSRGMKYNEINLTIDLGQEFHVAYVFVRMGISPRPGLWALEKSTDYGKTFKPWQYFSDSQYDCKLYFGEESLQPITRDDSVICNTEYSRIVPLEGGEIPISLLNSRPSANKYFNSSVLQEWTRATNVRLRLMRTKNMFGHLMSVARQDPTVTRRYFYSIKDISIGGRCMCNGHADTCDPENPPTESNILVCRCQHNTCGPQCAQCCPGFEQKKWRISQNWDKFECEPCNCHNHSTECVYDPAVDEKRLSLDIHGRYEGGGVCKNCQHNTEGINCNKCRPTFYRPWNKKWGEIDVCKPCQCDLHFSTGNCAEETGTCECRKEFQPPHCDACAYGYFDYPDCKPCTCNLNGTEGNNCTPVGGLCPCKFNYAGTSCEICADGYYSPECKNCECNSIGSVSQVCDKDTGNCTCKSKYSGRTCNQCEAGYFNYPTCKQCNCDISGTEASICDDVTGQCICKVGFGGSRCDQCISGYYMEVRGRERQCVPCNCSPTGSTSTSCSADGKCNCLVSFGGKQCAQCSPGYYKYPECLPCNCDVSGSLGSTCDDNGLCHCKPNFDGTKCDKCKPQFYNYPACEECNCDPRGVIPQFAGCGSVPEGELCLCKEYAHGRICNDCKPLFWNLQEYNPVGCEKCSCNVSGTLGGLGACDTKSGQCICKMNVGERQCDQCQDGFYQLESDNIFGCTECDCDPGGSIDNNCDKWTGQCRCHSRVEGRRCDRPIRAHYFPTLHQFQYEVEEGLTQSGPVRYRNNEAVFPGYSWKGYVVFSVLQNEVINIVHILSKSSLYRMVIKYANTLKDPVVASVIITPENVNDIQQKFSVLLKPTSEPQLVTVAGEKGLAPSPFVMNPGNWTVTIKTTKEVMIDYFVLIPETYYEATMLTKLVDKPCVVNDNNLCRHYVYPSVAGRPYADVTGLSSTATIFIDGEQQLKELNAKPNSIPVLSNEQNSLEYTMSIEPPGRYVLLIEYVTPSDAATSNVSVPFSARNTLTVRFQSGSDPETYAIAKLNECPYTSPCRQVVVNDLTMIHVVEVTNKENTVRLDGERDTLAGIKSIIAIPESEWHLDYMTPRPYCLRRNGKCEPAVFSAAVDSKKVEIETGSGGDTITQPPILDNSTAVVYLAPSTEPVTIETKVPTPGDYIFVVHYYQPDHPKSNVDAVIVIDGNAYQTLMPVEHCPSNSGCRSLLQQLDGRRQFPVTENITITFSGEGTKGVWLDYLLVVGAPDFTEAALREANLVDYTRQFIENCASNHYQISRNTSDFCRESMFSITSEYNSGALACLCDFMGSTELECDTFGGQCPCKPNVIGRSCRACRTGYYGFPNCKPCHCPSTAICDDNGKNNSDTFGGQCPRKPNVIGRSCRACRTGYYGFPNCKPCHCPSTAICDDNGKNNSDTFGGQCPCKPNVIGRSCRACRTGYYGFPNCKPCHCPSTAICDDNGKNNSDTFGGQCPCKPNVIGRSCRACRTGYYGFPNCKPCHCPSTAICDDNGKNNSDTFGGQCPCKPNVIGRSCRACRTGYYGFPNCKPCHCPSTAICDDNGKNNSDTFGGQYPCKPNVIGRSCRACKTGYYGFPNCKPCHCPSTAICDDNGKNNSDTFGGQYPCKPNVIGRSCRACKTGYYGFPNCKPCHCPSTAICDDNGKNNSDTFGGQYPCKPNVIGRSCRACKTGYYGFPNCKPCHCPSTAICDDNGKNNSDTFGGQCPCKPNVIGRSCRACRTGYYGFPNCKPCHCPSTAICDDNGKNNSDTFGGQYPCKPNVIGRSCRACKTGYYGFPNCKPCHCPSTAICDDNGKNNSDTFGGQCPCKPNVIGRSCRACRTGYYGFPNCKPCHCPSTAICDDNGKNNSDTFGGQYPCKPNVIGRSCRACKTGYYGFPNCKPCHCPSTAICDDNGKNNSDTFGGQYPCKPNVIGRSCRACKTGYYGFPNCKPCHCPSTAICDDNGKNNSDTFGGQCPCKPNVIGRSCRACRTGYYGFPNCKPCHCPSTAICDDNGMCICPKNVEGEDCNRCKKYTFNFDVQRGCDDCNCNPLGVVNNNLQCEADSGNCDCKENVIGRVCDHCVPGHYAFPDCVPCTCDRDGTTDDVCDQNTAQCFCKKHVRGQACNTCKEDYFNLQADNPGGCTKCYCFGKTTRCASSYLAWGEINGMSDWYLANIEVNRTLNIFPHPDLPLMQNDSTIEVPFRALTAQAKVLYFGAPQYYLGKRLTSYGGYLTYAIYYTAEDKGRPSAEPDLIIGGSNGYVLHNSIEQPPSETTWTHSVRISEDQFTNLDGSAVTRDQFMNILVNVTSIYVRATYWEEGIITQLMSVLLDVAVPVEYDEFDPAKQATSVEYCQCPPAYRGMSCEQCAAGYYRLSSGPHAGRCVPCQCNGHSRECDVNTGICLSCTDNTMGDHCEQCIIGYHGNAMLGTPRDCLICACPLPYASNNFAIGCELSENGSLISCDCQPGYGGARCEYCAAGYYGQPEVPGDYCKPCNCSGNINPDDPGSCDSITGDCLKCVNNTAGAACNLCAHGFFGDAIVSKNCTACICNDLGMDFCDPSTGICVCQPGVIGEKCDRCEDNHWGLNSGRGCTPCDCALASNSTQCDDNTGQCSCAKGVTGRHCEHCAAGYWNYNKNGCDHCNCNTGYSVGFMCNATGQCECLPGVIGEKCDRCPERWVLIPNQGCQECDSCTDALIFTVQDLRDLLLNETQEFKDKADSFFTTQRLNYISNQTEALRPRVSELQNVDLADVTTAFRTLESAAKNLLRSAEFAATDSDKQIGRAADLALEANKILRTVRSSADEAAAVIAHVADLATGLELSQQPKVDSALTEAKQIRDDLADKDLKPKQLVAVNALNNATTQIERMNIFVQPVNEQAKRFDALVNNTRDLKKKLDEMLEYTDLAQHTVEMAKRLNFKNRQSKSNSKVGSVTDLSSAAMLDLIDAAHDTTNATKLTNVASDAVADATNALEDNRQQNVNVDDRILELNKRMADLHNFTNVARHHAMGLSNRADYLREVAKRENNNTRTQDAYAAASAYSSIVQEIADAKMAADQADEADRNATDIENDLKQRVGPAREKSQKLLQDARQALDTVDKTLGPNLTLAISSLDSAAETLGRAEDDTNAIELAMPPPSTFALQEEAAKADRVNAVVRDTRETMSELGKHLASSKDWAQTLPKQADEAQKMAANVQSLLKQTEITDAVDAKYRAVKNRQEDLEHRRAEANAKLLRLKEQIEQARTIANRIQFGVSFDRLSTLQLRLPDNIDEMSTSTQVSAYFRTKEKDGFLLYLGNPKDTMLRRSKSDDFMVLSIQNGYPRLEMDIGDSYDSGRDPAKFISDKYVADNQWYQVIVNRVGRSVKLSIREALANGSEFTHSKEGMLPGTHTIFNLDKQKSKLYVGGVPSDAKLQKISFPAFEGQIEELMIGDTPVGLWNFVNATNLKGSRQRNKLITPPVWPQEYRFNGRSHVTMSGSGYLEPEKNHIQLFFRTYAPNGLIYLVGENNHFFSVQMQDGAVYLQVAFGPREEDLVILGTSKTYNDGNWHKLDATRYLSDCSLKVDGEILRSVLSSSVKEIPATDTMNFGGGNKDISRITNQGFDGCIRQISIDRINVELSDSIESIGMVYGCQFSSLVSLSGQDSYLRYQNITSENPQVTLKFQTSSPDGLLFVYSSRTLTASSQDLMSLSLIKGQLVLTSQREKLDTGLNTYNDSQWHVVTVTHGAKALKMVIDDYDYYSTDTAPEPLHILNGVLFIGGVQPGYVMAGKIGSRAPFQGCIADATLNGRVLNLLEPLSNSSVTFGRCGSVTSTGGVLPGGDYPTLPPPTVLPTPPPATEAPDVTSAPDTSSGRAFDIQATPKSTAVTAVPTTPRPRPQPESGCALAHDNYYTVGDPEEGYRFGSRRDSRIEYGKLPGRQLELYDLSINFRTFDKHGGLIFYAEADGAPEQFLAVYMINGLLHVAFNCGERTGRVSSSQAYNDTEWHQLTLVRNGGHSKVTVDNKEVGETSVACVNPKVLAPPFFYGGLRKVTAHYNDTVGFYQPFKGCLKGLLMNGQVVKDVQQRVNALRCVDNVEDGLYFEPAKGEFSSYLKLVNHFRVGNEVGIAMEVKPRNSTGLLLSVYGKKDYLVIEMLENEVVARVENGKGPFQASFNFGDNFSLCDGKWHRIHALKSHHVVTIGVDGHFSDAVLGQSGSTDTRYGLFIGGHERDVKSLPGTQSRQGFVGCIRNIQIKEKTVTIPSAATSRGVHIGVCPLD